MDPLKEPAAGGGTPFFRGAGTDAAKLRELRDRLFSLAPEGSVMAEPERREKLAKSLDSAGRTTAEFAAVQAFVPGRAGRIFGTLFSGLDKEAASGKIRPGVGTGLNAAPKPIGYVDPQAVSLKPNFYLPSGITAIIPRPIDRVGYGLPEQRLEDDRAAMRREANEQASQRVKAAKIVAAESNLTLANLIAGPGGLTRASVVVATSELPIHVLQSAAERELIARARGERLSFPETVTAVTRSIQVLRDEQKLLLEATREDIERLDVEEARIRADLAAVGVVLAAGNGPLATPPLPGSKHTTDIQPVTGRAIANQEAARGIRRELVSERADP